MFDQDIPRKASVLSFLGDADLLTILDLDLEKSNWENANLKRVNLRQAKLLKSRILCIWKHFITNLFITNIIEFILKILV